MPTKVKIYSPISSVSLVSDKQAQRSTLKQVVKFVDYFRTEKIPTDHILKTKELDELKTHFFSQYDEVIACGGIVINEKNELLLIYRRGFWDLPKGKIETGEKKKACALREVEEECGVKGLKIIDKLQLDYNGQNVTYHTYTHKGKATLKPSYWYLMSAKKQKLIPQMDEDITEAKWVKLKHISDYYKNAYPTIIDVLRSTIAQLDQ